MNLELFCSPMFQQAKQPSRTEQSGLVDWLLRFAEYHVSTAAATESAVAPLAVQSAELLAIILPSLSVCTTSAVRSEYDVPVLE